VEKLLVSCRADAYLQSGIDVDSEFVARVGFARGTWAGELQKPVSGRRGIADAG
jgi:hypothetical protein